MASTVQGRTPTTVMTPRPDADREEPTPLCRCRALYLGSTSSDVLHEGLHGIQHHLEELYPEQGAKAATGIDSWISVWSNGLLLENIDEHRKKVTKFFSIESLQYCAAIRYVKITAPPDVTRGRFFPLDSDVAKKPNAVHPPLFACTLHSKTKAKPPECLLFICKNENHANSLVRCCFHAYADTMHAKQLETAVAPSKTTRNNTVRSPSQISMGFQQNGVHVNGNGTVKVPSSRVPNADNRVPYNGFVTNRLGTPASVPGVPTPLPPHPQAYSVYDPSAIGTVRSVHSAMRVPVVVTQPAPAPAPKESSTWKFLTLKQRKKKKSQQEDAPPPLPVRRAASVFSIPTSSRPPSVMLPAGIQPLQQPFHSSMAAPLAAAQPAAYLVPVTVGKSKGKSVLKFGTFSARSKKSKELATVLPGPYTVVQPGMLSGSAPAPMVLPPPAQPAPASLRRISSQTTLRPDYRPYDLYPMEQQQLVIGTVRGPPPAMTMRKPIQGPTDNFEQMSLMSSSRLYEEGNMTVRGLPHPVMRQQHQSRPFGTFSGYPSNDLRPHDKKERELIQMVQELVLNENGTESSQLPTNKYSSPRNGIRF